MRQIREALVLIDHWVSYSFNDQMSSQHSHVSTRPSSRRGIVYLPTNLKQNCSSRDPLAYISTLPAKLPTFIMNSYSMVNVTLLLPLCSDYKLSQCLKSTTTNMLAVKRWPPKRQIYRIWYLYILFCKLAYLSRNAIFHHKKLPGF